jgi:hypothetical protein
MINTFPAEKKTIKNNVLFVKITQVKKETNANLRTI